MSDKSESIMFFVIGAALGFVIGLWIMISLSAEYWHDVIIKNGSGRYHPITGEFEFINPESAAPQEDLLDLFSQ